MATYKIRTKLGYDLANGMKAGDTITATDGSVWSKDASGNLTVRHGGKVYAGEITYQPETVAPVVQPTKQEYTSPYAEQLKQTIADIQGAKWEGWDKDSDPSYQALRKEHLREADRTAEDTLARYAQNTGGIAGSQAIAAASQAADYQKAKLSDAIPTLHDNAYSRYLGELQQKQNVAGLLMSAESQEQSRYYQQLSYAMNKWAQMGYADDEVASILGVAAGTPTSDQSYTDWAKAFEERQYSASLASKGSVRFVEDTEPYKFDKDDYAAEEFKNDTAAFESLRNRLVTGTKTNAQQLEMIRAALEGNTISAAQAKQLMEFLGL